MKFNIVILINSADQFSDTPPIQCKDKVIKVLSLGLQVAAKHAYSMSETVTFETKIKELCIVILDQSDGLKWYLMEICRQHVNVTHFLLDHLELVRSV